MPDSIPDHAKGSEVIRRMLSSLNQISQGIAELRNSTEPVMAVRGGSPVYNQGMPNWLSGQPLLWGHS